MNLADALPPNELLLAQLTASKLAKVMHGLMSVGTACLELESPTDFLAGRHNTLLGFLEVLRCIGVKPGHADKVPLLRARVSELSELAKRFHGSFMELARWRDMSPQDISAAVDRLGDSYAQFCQQLGLFCALLGLDWDYSDQAQQDRSILEAFFQTVGAIVPNR